MIRPQRKQMVYSVRVTGEWGAGTLTKYGQGYRKPAKDGKHLGLAQQREVPSLGLKGDRSQNLKRAAAVAIEEGCPTNAVAFVRRTQPLQRVAHARRKGLGE